MGHAFTERLYTCFASLVIFQSFDFQCSRTVAYRFIFHAQRQHWCHYYHKSHVKCVCLGRVGIRNKSGHSSDFLCTLSGKYLDSCKSETILESV